MKPASWAISSADKTTMDQKSIFSEQISKILKDPNINSVIETGTFRGTGTTKIVLDNRLSGVVLYSIEVNPHNHDIAKNNLKEYSNLALLLGNTLPQQLIPSVESIRKYIRRHECLDIYCDYDIVASDRLISSYTQESGHSVPCDILGKILKEDSVHPGLIILDSAGHLGFLEFLYILYLLRNSCYIAMDDINHVKHYDSFKYAMSNAETFDFIDSKDEKTGWAIVKYLYKDQSLFNMGFEDFCRYAMKMYENGE